MRNESRVEPSLGKGFTLIELLIVVAIIAILAAIAIPNFLEAQARAKVARAMNDMRTLFVAHQAYITDWQCPLADQNDSINTPQWRKYQPYNFFYENPNVTPDIVFIGDRNWVASFYTFAQFAPLTTPIAYTTQRPLDSFSRVVPCGLDTREIDSNIVYWVFMMSGPDKDSGDWYRGYDSSGRSVKYDPTNGTVSSGDIWRGEAYSDAERFAREYPYAM